MYNGEDTIFSPEERYRLVIKDNIIHQHSYVRFNFTAYDVRRAQDCISLRSGRRDIVVPSSDSETTHPFWYARVLGIYHTFAADGARGTHPAMKRVEFLWVHWFGLDLHWSGARNGHLDRIGFVDPAEPGAFGFISPNDVIRACHIIPAFAYGRMEGQRSISSFQKDDWEYYYVNRYDTLTHLREL
jgi:hypothetical protein